MSDNTTLNGISDADLATAGGRGHLVKVDTSSNYRIDLATVSDDRDIIGMLANNDADAAGETAHFVFCGIGTGRAGGAIQPLAEVINLSDSEFGAFVPGSGETVVGRYVPTLKAGATNLAAAVAGEWIRVYLYERKEAKAGQVVGAARIEYDFSVDGGAIGSIGTGVYLPDNAVVRLSSIEVLTTCTSATDAATIAITSADVTVDAAIAISDGTNPWDAGLRVGDHTATSTTWEKTTSRQELSFVIAVEAVTAGRILAYVEYLISE